MRQSGRCSAGFCDLPHELLEAVLRLVPETTTNILGSALKLKSRGPVERVCRRWRRFALQLPASLTVNLCTMHNQGLDAARVAAALAPVLPLVSKRCISALTITGCPESLPAALPASLARALYPQLLRLELGGSSLLHWTTFLPLCTRLEVLDITLPDEDDDEEEDGMDGRLLRSHLCGLGCRLQQLRLQVDTAVPGLDSTISDHVQPAALVMTAYEPSAIAWVPQLTQCTVTIYDSTQLPWLASGLEASASLVQLRSLTLRDVRMAAVRAALPPALPGLARLPALCKMVCGGSVPQAVWACPHLTSLILDGTTNPGGYVPESGAALCTSLRQLRSDGGCKLPGGAFPAALCPGLQQLSSLEIVGSGLTGGLPPAFSRLSSLQQLVISRWSEGGVDEAPVAISAASVRALRDLRGLTALRLPSCNLEGLPAGLGLSSLKSLEICGNPALGSPIPFAATAARDLRALSISCPGEDWEAADWLELEWKLHCFPRLEVLYLDDILSEPAKEALDALICSNCFTFQLRLPPDASSELCEHRVFSGLAKFDSAA